MLLLCGITASCIKFCCWKKRPPVQPFPRHPYDLTGVAIDSDSTAHSTVTCKYPWESATQPCFAVERVHNAALSPCNTRDFLSSSQNIFQNHREGMGKLSVIRAMQ